MKTVTPKLQFLDLSHWTGAVDWDRLAQNKDLIAVGWKASEGNYNTDATYAAARVEAEKRGYLWLAYHFGTSNPVQEQVDRFLSSAKPDAKTRLALDWEDYADKQMSVQQVIDFLSLLDARIGRRSTLYTGNTGRDMLGSTARDFLTKHPLWIPRYSVDVSQQPKVQASWEHWDIWQYAADGSGLQPNTAVGVSGHPDCNVFYDDVETVRANWAGAPLTIPTPAVPAPAPEPVVVTITINAPAGVKINIIQTSGETM